MRFPRKLLRLLKTDKKGSVAIIAALTLPLVIGGAAFGIEVGYWRYDQVRVQQASDAAAYAAAVVKRSGGADLSGAATASATSNGYSSTSDTLAVNAPSTATPPIAPASSRPCRSAA
jgi:Flp pilus assembly protein TadG